MTRRARAFVIASLILLGGCVHPDVPLKKSHLLDPMMDPAKTDTLHRAFLAEPSLWLEKSGADSAGAMGASCPTCGG
jgi:hypothetical protein